MVVVDSRLEFDASQCVRTGKSVVSGTYCQTHLQPGILCDRADIASRLRYLSGKDGQLDKVLSLLNHAIQSLNTPDEVLEARNLLVSALATVRELPQMPSRQEMEEVPPHGRG